MCVCVCVCVCVSIISHNVDALSYLIHFNVFSHVVLSIF